MKMRDLIRKDLKKEFRIRRKTTRSKNSIVLQDGVIMMEVEGGLYDVSNRLADSGWNVLGDGGGSAFMQKHAAGQDARIMLIGASDDGTPLTRIGPAPR